MCRALMPGDEESMSDEAIWETLPVSSEFIYHFGIKVVFWDIYATLVINY